MIMDIENKLNEGEVKQAKKMLSMGIKEKDIEEATGLSMQEIAELKEA